MWSVICLLLFSLLNFSSVQWFFSIIVGFFFYFIQFNYVFYSGNPILNNKFFFFDSISFYFIFLSFILFIFVYFLELVNFSYLFNFLLSFLFFSLVLLFLAKTWLYFLIFFEASFIFMFLIIMFWGNNPERIEALNYFIIYSLVGSVPIIIVFSHFVFYGTVHFYGFDCNHTLLAYASNLINVDFYQRDVYIYQNIPGTHGNVRVRFLCESGLCEGLPIVQTNAFFLGYNAYSLKEYFFVISWLIIFLIKFPIFGLHLWLPKAHVESPVFGSMILAGILIKLSVYGIVRFGFSVFHGFYFKNFEIPIFLNYYACFGLVIVNFICSIQWDLKSFVAYSSVVHMSLIIFSILSNSWVSLIGALILSFSHGICSSSLFMMVNNFYSISLSRSMYLNRGYLYIFPYLCMFWFLLVSSNCSIPLSLNFFSELFLIFSGVLLNLGSLFVFVFNIFFCGLYCIFLYLYVSHGKSNVGLNYNCNFVYTYIYLMLCLFHFFVIYFYMTVVNTVSLVL
uniref:NADH-ubiquinone oxidoreductase chain 4 n=1 Tax=Parakontikia atrata TaxID=2903269 RepID=A0A9E8AE10_9PLAT|nr:NADH dehydrogenase subunit 4 [Parakontikia atrata]UZA66420.1 NADH dehydrogenase subunit 4 [Parakontikia atrata]